MQITVLICVFIPYTPGKLIYDKQIINRPKEQIITGLNVQSNHANYCSKIYMTIIIKTKLYNPENPFEVLVAFFMVYLICTFSFNSRHS